MDYYYLLNRIKKGPVSLEELKELKLEKNTLVWKEGLTDWTNANNLDELKELFKVSPPPVPPPPIPPPDVPPPAVQSPKIATPPPMPSNNTTDDTKKTIERTGRSEEKKNLTNVKIPEMTLTVENDHKTTETPPPFSKKTSNPTKKEKSKIKRPLGIKIVFWIGVVSFALAGIQFTNSFNNDLIIQTLGLGYFIWAIVLLPVNFFAFISAFNMKKIGPIIYLSTSIIDEIWCASLGIFESTISVLVIRAILLTVLFSHFKKMD